MHFEVICPFTSCGTTQTHLGRIHSASGPEIVVVKSADPRESSGSHIRNEAVILLHLCDSAWVPRSRMFIESNIEVLLCTSLYMGGDLMTHLETKGTFGLGTCRSILVDLFTALHDIHSRGVIHRDIKPDNLVFDKQSGLKVIDFGLAHRIGDFRSSEFGSVDYMAPEVISGGSGYDVAVDYWSAGIIMYEMLFGGPPFSDEDRDRNTTIYRILHSEKYLVFPNGLSQDYIEAADLIQRLLRSDPSERICDANEVLSHEFFNHELTPQVCKKLAKSFDFVGYLDKLNRRNNYS